MKIIPSRNKREGAYAGTYGLHHTRDIFKTDKHIYNRNLTIGRHLNKQLKMYLRSRALAAPHFPVLF